MPRSKLSEENRIEILSLAANEPQMSHEALAAQFGVRQSTITRLINGTSHSGTSGIQVRYVEVAKVQPDPGQPRKTFDERTLADLAASIRERGQLNPAVVRKHPSAAGMFMIIAGERRWRACSAHGIPKLLCRIVETEADADIKVDQVIENLQREEVPPIEEAHAFQAIMDETGWTAEQLGKKLGFTQPWRVRDRLALLKIKPEYQKLAGSGQVSWTCAFEMSRLSPAGQDKMFQAYKTGQCTTLGQLRQLSQRLQDQENQPEMFAAPKPPSPEETKVINRLETSIDRMANMLSQSIRDNEIVILERISGNKAETYADKLKLIRGHCAQLENALRATVATAPKTDLLN